MPLHSFNQPLIAKQTQRSHAAAAVCVCARAVRGAADQPQPLNARSFVNGFCDREQRGVVARPIAALAAELGIPGTGAGMMSF